MRDRITERAIDIVVRGQDDGTPIQQWLSAMMKVICGNPTAVVELFAERHARGLETYGVSLSDAELTEDDCKQHLAEELADALKYAIKLDEIRKQPAAATPDREGEI